MKASVEISYYPLNADYLNIIQDFIDRLNLHKNIKVQTNVMATQIFGEFEEIMDILKMEMGKSFELPSSMFVMKVYNKDLSLTPYTK